uniref:Transcription activation suppressor family member 2 n=1 Tax=Jaculus jaculus TaxID=51337 RepID=A0A8C5KX66_JACJA
MSRLISSLFPGFFKGLICPWKGRLVVQGCLLSDITLWPTRGTVFPSQLPQELDFKYVMKVSSLKERLPEDAFRRRNYLEEKVYCQNLCFDLYEVELSNKQGENIDKLTEYIKNKQLAIIKCLEDRGFFILLTSSALIAESDFGAEQMGLHGLHLFHSPLSTGVQDLKIEDDISLKVIPILPAFNCALLEAKKSLSEERTPPNMLVKHNFQELYKMDKSLSLMAAPWDAVKEIGLARKWSTGSDLVPPPEKCSLDSLIQLKAYLSDPDGYTLEVATVLDSLVEHPLSPCISDGVCDAGFSLVMTPDPEFLDSEAEVETEKSAEDMLTEESAVVVVSPASALRAQPKRKASPPAGVNLCRPLPERAVPWTDNELHTSTTLKLAKGQFSPKRKRGAEVLTAQFVQKTKPVRKNPDPPYSNSKDVPVKTNTKRARKQEKAQVIPKAKPPVKKKRKGTVLRGHQKPRHRKQPQSETTLYLQSEISSDGPKDGINICIAQSERIGVAPKDLPENSIISFDSQALNMLADLALSSAAVCTPSCEPKALPICELPQSTVLPSKENSLHSTSDHEYHRGVKSQKSIPQPKPPSDRKSNSESDFAVSQEGKLLPGSQPPAQAQLVLSEEAQEPSDTGQSSVAVEHSYALLLAEQSKKHLHQRRLPSPAFAKNGTKGPEAGTPVGKVMPFRHLQNTSPLQKLPEDSLIKRKSRCVSSNLKDFFCSHTVLNSDGSLKVTFKCEAGYAFSLDSKYTSNPLEKTVVRALHGPWNMNLPENMEEVKLLLHMWVALFYSKKNRVMGSPRKVVEHRNPAKYVCINRSLESIDLSEIEELSGVERCPVDPLLETNTMSNGRAAEVPFPGPDCMLPFIKPPTTRDLELCVQNEQKELFAGHCHLDASESQSFIYSGDNEVFGRKSKQDLSDKLEASNVVPSGIASTQTNGSCIPSEDKSFQSGDGTGMVSCDDTVTQTTFTTAYDGTSSQSVMCPKSVFSTLENKLDIFHPTMQTKTGVVQDFVQHSSPMNNGCLPSPERMGDNSEYMVINLEPVTLAFGKNACSEVSIADRSTDFHTEVVKQVLPVVNVQHPVPTLEKVQTLDLTDSPFLLSGQEDAKYLPASSVNKDAREDLYPVQRETPLSVSSQPDESASVMDAVPLAKRPRYSPASEEMKCPQDALLQTANLFSTPSEEGTEPSQGAVTSPTLGKKCSLDCIAPRSDTSDGFLELRNGDQSSPNHKRILQSFNLLLSNQTNLSVNEELSREDSDTDLRLTVLPPASPREAMPAGEMEQVQVAASSLGLIEGLEKVVELEEEATLIKKRELMPASYMSLWPLVSGEPLGNERKGDTLKPVTEINMTSSFPFDSLIEVSPPSSPDPQAVSPCSLKHHGIYGEKSNKLSQIGSVELGMPEKENSYVSPAHPLEQAKFTPGQHSHLSAEVPLVLTGCPAAPDPATEQVVPSEHGEGTFSSRKVQGDGAELNKPTSLAKYRSDPLEKLVKPGNSLQLVSVEDSNLGLKHFVSESNVPPFSPRKIVENKPLADMLPPTSAVSGVVNVSLKQKTSRENKRAVHNSHLKTHVDSYTQAESVNSASIDGADVTQVYMYPEIPELASPSDSATCTHGTRSVRREPEFQTREIPVVRMASLLTNNEAEAELCEDRTGLRAAGLHSHATSIEGEQKLAHMLQGTTACERRELLNDSGLPTCVVSYQHTANSGKSTSKTPHASLIPESFDTVTCGISKDDAPVESISEGHIAKANSEALSRDAEKNITADIYYEPLSGSSDQDAVDCANPKVDMEKSYSLSSLASNKDKIRDHYDLCMNLKNSNDGSAYSNKLEELEIHTSPKNWTIGPYSVLKKDKYVPGYVQIPDPHGILRTYANFTITKEFKDTRRTLHGLKRRRSLPAKCSLLSSWTSTWQVADDATQNTLDLECLRFSHKLKRVLKKGDSQQSAPFTISPKELPTQVEVETCPAMGILDSPSSWKEKCTSSRNLKNSERNSFHLNKLKYNSIAKESRNDISLILSEYAEFNKVMMNNSQERELSTASREAASQGLSPSLPRQTPSYKDIITDLCDTLHVKLKGVLREACKSPFWFYLVETEDKPFLLRTKNILRKGGHTEIEPLHFCQAHHRENDTLIVIIKNEDISSYLHQIPSLLKLKRLPSVVFAGVDGPEDILNDSYEELLHSGGFVVSDDKLLETLTLVQLKEIVKTLEKLNENGRWKWLLHYRENKKLKEDVRVDSTAQKKHLILKSYQSADIIELLHYHHCDSLLPKKAGILKCLLKLQIQHTSTRFAVFLTDKPAVSTEVFESNGILVTDVNYFIENMQKVASPFRRSYW